VLHLDALAAAHDPASRASLERRARAAEVRGFALGALLGATLVAEVSGAVPPEAALREAEHLGHAALIARIRRATSKSGGAA